MMLSQKDSVTRSTVFTSCFGRRHWYLFWYLLARRRSALETIFRHDSKLASQDLYILWGKTWKRKTKNCYTIGIYWKTTSAQSQSSGSVEWSCGDNHYTTAPLSPSQCNFSFNNAVRAKYLEFYALIYKTCSKSLRTLLIK